MLKPEIVQKRLDAARKTLSSLRKRKEQRINLSKKSLMSYCTETIMFCEVLLVLIKENE